MQVIQMLHFTTLCYLPIYPPVHPLSKRNSEGFTGHEYFIEKEIECSWRQTNLKVV